MSKTFRFACIFAFCSTLSQAGEPSPLSSSSPLPAVTTSAAANTPPLRAEGRLRKNVDFWIRIYSQYTTSQGLIHDAKYIDIIYEVMDFQSARRSQGRMIREAKNRYKSILLAIHRKQSKPDFLGSLNDEEKRVVQLYKDVNEPNKFLNAAHRKRMRFQLGQKDRFLEGLHESGRYLPAMEEIFRREGLPVELTRLPFVESSFNTKARSKVGASGIWQFMPSTGRTFLAVNHTVDERNDPLRATEAAAQLLKVNYDSLKSWPLAITAYNHGRMGMLRAVAKVGSENMDEIVSDYKSRTFGFASSNFFTELLAAIECERNSEKYFGKVARAPALQFVEVQIPDSIKLTELSKFLKVDKAQVRSLNPGLSDAIISGHTLLPATYHLRLPYDSTLSKEGQVRVFLAGYEQIPGIYKQKRHGRPIYGRSKSQKTESL
ncbi:MAG: lytic transglycosylase domain-containing protein [Methylotenera sp.]|nr:lytic transglycosylase domain-containing protein [Oligoflexia bacterium]